MRMAIRKAKAVGCGTVVVRNAGHFGAIGYFARMAADDSCVGQVLLSSGGNMPPPFGRAPRLGTNPHAWSAPAGSEVPFMLDMATTQVAGNKLSLAARLGVPLPANWIAQADGTILTEEVEAPDLRTAMLLPIGGVREQGSHKGYGLAVASELMTHSLASTGGHHVPSVSAPERVITGKADPRHGENATALQRLCTRY
jgi:LDH2 family malate/lactate/ureidoglycolate dehydrogenase